MARSAPMSVRARTALTRMAKAAAGLRPAVLLRALPLVLALGVFEAWGRYSSNDGIDLAGLVGLVFVCAWIQGRHGESLKRFWSVRMRSRVQLMAAPWRLEFGVDLRGRPTLPQGRQGGIRLYKVHAARPCPRLTPLVIMDNGHSA